MKTGFDRRYTALPMSLTTRTTSTSSSAGVEIVRYNNNNNNSGSSRSNNTSHSHHTSHTMVDSPHSMLSPDDTAWLVAQIGQLKIEQTHDHDFVDDSHQTLSK